MIALKHSYRLANICAKFREKHPIVYVGLGAVTVRDRQMIKREITYRYPQFRQTVYGEENMQF